MDVVKFACLGFVLLVFSGAAGCGGWWNGYTIEEAEYEGPTFVLPENQSRVSDPEYHWFSVSVMSDEVPVVSIMESAGCVDPPVLSRRMIGRIVFLDVRHDATYYIGLENEQVCVQIKQARFFKIDCE